MAQHAGYKVTIEGHEFEPFFFSCPFLISFTPGRIFIDLYSNVHLSETLCKTYVSAMPTQGQGHSWRRQLSFRLPFCWKENCQQTSQRNTVQSSRLGSQRKCQKHPYLTVYPCLYRTFNLLLPALMKMCVIVCLKVSCSVENIALDPLFNSAEQCCKSCINHCS